MYFCLSCTVSFQHSQTLSDSTCTVRELLSQGWVAAFPRPGHWQIRRWEASSACIRWHVSEITLGVTFRNTGMVTSGEAVSWRLLHTWSFRSHVRASWGRGLHFCLPFWRKWLYAAKKKPWRTHRPPGLWWRYSKWLAASSVNHTTRKRSKRIAYLCFWKPCYLCFKAVFNTMPFPFPRSTRPAGARLRVCWRRDWADSILQLHWET